MRDELADPAGHGPLRAAPRRPASGFRRRAVLGLTLAGLAPIPGLRPALAEPGAEAGIVTQIVGVATATQGGESRELHTGAVVRQSDSLRTGAGARLLLTLVDGSTLAMGEESQLVLTSITGEAGIGGMVFDLLAGIVRAVLGSTPPDLFAVRGRVAVAAARATDFIVETDASLTTVFVANGEVVVGQRYGQEEAVLGPGAGIDVRRGLAMPPPRAWGQARIDGVFARTAMRG